MTNTNPDLDKAIDMLIADSIATNIVGADKVNADRKKLKQAIEQEIVKAENKEMDRVVQMVAMHSAVTFTYKGKTYHINQLNSKLRKD